LMVDQCKYIIAFEFTEVKGRPSFSRSLIENGSSVKIAF
jgi:hypothetical protein